MNNKLSFIRLSNALGAGYVSLEMLSTFEDTDDIFRATSDELVSTGAFTRIQAKKVLESKEEQAEKCMLDCEKNGWDIMTFGDDDYPDYLRRISNPPAVLYIWGERAMLNRQPSIGVVGTRKPVSTSIEVAREISAQLVRAGITVISGGALGIDSVAHEGALLAKGKTVAVLGCGLGTPYLRANEALRFEISRSGAVISEFAPFEGASKVSFPIRNRIISGLSRGVLVVEAGEKSGSIITANYAMEQGKDVFAVPGDVVTSHYAGANRLIRLGAKAVSQAEDIIEEYAPFYPDTVGKYLAERKSALRVKPENPKEKPIIRRELPVHFSQEARRVYEFITTTPTLPGEIAVSCSLSLPKAFTVLTELEIYGYISSCAGGGYILK